MSDRTARRYMLAASHRTGHDGQSSARLSKSARIRSARGSGPELHGRAHGRGEEKRRREAMARVTRHYTPGTGGAYYAGPKLVPDHMRRLPPQPGPPPEHDVEFLHYILVSRAVGGALWR